MIFQASTSILGRGSISQFFLNCRQLLQRQRRMRVGLQPFGGVSKITLRGRQVAASGFEVASNDLITRYGGQRFEFGDGWSGFAGLSPENQNADAFAQNRGTRNAAIRLVHARERLAQKN